MKKGAILVMLVMLMVCLSGCMSIGKLGETVFAGAGTVDRILIRDEETGEVTLLTDSESIDKLVSEINNLLCLQYSDGVESSDSNKDVRYTISFNPSSDDISLDDNLLFVFSENEFNYGKNRFMAILGGLSLPVSSSLS